MTVTVLGLQDFREERERNGQNVSAAVPALRKRKDRATSSLLVSFCSFGGFMLTCTQHTEDYVSRNGRLFRAILLSERSCDLSICA